MGVEGASPKHPREAAKAMAEAKKEGECIIIGGPYGVEECGRWSTKYCEIIQIQGLEKTVLHISFRKDIMSSSASLELDLLVRNTNLPASAGGC